MNSRLWRLFVAENAQMLMLPEDTELDDYPEPGSVDVPELEWIRREGRKKLAEPRLFYLWDMSWGFAYRLDDPAAASLRQVFDSAGLTPVISEVESVPFAFAFVTDVVEIDRARSQFNPLGTPTWVAVGEDEVAGRTAFFVAERGDVLARTSFVEQLRELEMLDHWDISEIGEIV